MKKLLFAASAALCIGLVGAPALGQVTTYTDTAPTGERISVPVTPSKPLPVTGTISASTSATAVSLCSNAVAAGTGKPLATDLFSALCVINVDPVTHQPLDPSAALPAGTSIIGKVTTDQTTHGTTDLIAADLTKVGGTAITAGVGNATTGSPRMALGFAGATQYIFSTTTAETIEVVPLSGSLVTYVLFDKVVADGTVTFTWKYGTGTNCGTGTTTLEGAYNLTAQNGWVEGNGAAPVLIVPAGKALCRTTSAGTVQTAGKVLAVQF